MRRRNPITKESSFANKDLRNGFEFQKYLTSAVLLGLILLLGTALRFYDLGAESYWIDEMYTVIESQQSISQLLTSGRLDQPPAYYLPFYLWVRIFGTAEVSTRSFSALIGIASIILIYLIGRELFGKAVGLLSAFLMTISAFQIYFSQEARYYIYFQFMTLLSFLFFILAIKAKRTVHFALYGVASTLMVYSHAFGIFILAAQILFLILERKNIKNLMTPWLICEVLILLAIIPYFYPLLFKGSVTESIMTQGSRLFPIPSLSAPLGSIYRFILPARREQSWEIILSGYAVAGTLLSVGTWIYALRRGRSKWVARARDWVANLREVPDLTQKLSLVSCWLVCPIMLPFIFSLMFIPIYTDRYMIGAAPAWYLLLALGLFSVRKVVPLVISLSVLVIMVTPGLRHYYVADIHEQWREAAAFVEEHAGGDEVIVFAPLNSAAEKQIQQRSLNWYYQGSLQGCGLGMQLIGPVAISEALLQCLSGHDRFWVILQDASDSEIGGHFRSFFSDPNQTTMHKIKEHQFVGIAVYLFELTEK